MVLELRLESPIWIDVLWLAVIYWHTNILSGFAASFSSGFVSQSIHIHISFYLWLVLRLPIHWRPTSKFGPFFFLFLIPFQFSSTKHTHCIRQLFTIQIITSNCLNALLSLDHLLLLSLFSITIYTECSFFRRLFFFFFMRLYEIRRII